MPHKFWLKIVIAMPAIILMLFLDQIQALQGLPLLALMLGVALLLTERLRVWLQRQGRSNVALLPFMGAALLLLLAFCRDRDLSQAILFIVTIGVVFDILLMALAIISEASKRGIKGVAEFVGLAGLGLMLGLILSLVFLLPVGGGGGTSLAGP